MDAWSQERCLRANLFEPWRVTGLFAVTRTMTGRLTPALPGRLRVAVPGDSLGIARADGVMDDVAAVPTDADLMALVAAGDQRAFAAVYDRHARAVYGAVVRYLRDPEAAEDIVQETYLAVWTKADGYSPEAGSLIGWLLAIARHRAVDRLRAASRRPQAAGLPREKVIGGESDLERQLAIGRPVSLASAPGEPSEVAERRWVRAVVRTAMDRMPEPERQVLRLAYDSELSQAEIAERLGWPIGTVKTRTRRALLRLRAMLESVPDIAPWPSRQPAGPDPMNPEEVPYEPR